MTIPSACSSNVERRFPRPTVPQYTIDLSSVAAIPVAQLPASPGATVAAAVRRDNVWSFGIGAAGRLWFDKDAPWVTPKTPYDLASLTKPVLALAAAREAREARLSLDEPLGDLLPELSSTRSGLVPLESASGPPWRP